MAELLRHHSEVLINLTQEIQQVTEQEERKISQEEQFAPFSELPCHLFMSALWNPRHVLRADASRERVLGPAVPATPGSLVEMQILSSTPDPTNHPFCPPGNSDVNLGLRTTAVSSY